MPYKRLNPTKPNPQSKPAKPPDAEPEELASAPLRPTPHSLTLLRSPILRAQRQQAAARLGRIGGNTRLGKILAGRSANVIQRENGDTEAAGAEAAAEAPPAGTTAAEMDAIVQAELEAFLDEFSNIEVTVRWVEVTETACVQREAPVTFHPPYFMNVTDRSSAAAETLDRYDDAVSERGAADRAIQNFIREFSRSERRGGWGLGRALVGKSTPGDIQRIVQGALDQNLIPTPAGANYPDGEAIRAWLQRYGIGVDCSAFVSQALNRAAAQVLGRDLTTGETLNRGSAALAGGASGFTRVDDPADLRPGDTMRIPGHIRIITRVSTDESGGTLFTTAESRAGGAADVGPDRADWRYNGETLQIRRSPGDAWSDTRETPTFGRYGLLESARAE
jgi:hypothetical protein